MTNKEEIIIDGVTYNKCNGCPLYDGNVCTGARTYEDNAERDRRICDEHLAAQFWVVFNKLKRKEQECEELKREIAFGNNGKLSDKIRAIVFKDLNDENSKYKQALDEIQNYVRDNSDFDKSDELTSNTGAYDILEIINKAKE